MEGMSKTILVVGAMASAMVLASMAAIVLTAKPGAGKPQTVTLVGAGDINSCNEKWDRKTASLLGKNRGNRLHPRRQRLPRRHPPAVPRLLRSHLGQVQEAHQALSRR
jgi:hypothetical protein